MTEWDLASAWERDWWGDCVNTLYEEEKQMVYAEKMGLTRTPNPKTPYVFDLKGASVLDIGGGATSLLLKCVNFHDSWVVDPLISKHPKWVIDRYKSLGIKSIDLKGEELDKAVDMLKWDTFDECLVYNVLEHCEDPKKVIDNAKKLGKIVRLFEWIDTGVGVNSGHIHSFTEQQLNEWLGGQGKTDFIKRGGAVGHAYFGIWKGDNYVTSSS